MIRGLLTSFGAVGNALGTGLQSAFGKRGGAPASILEPPEYSDPNQEKRMKTQELYHRRIIEYQKRGMNAQAQELVDLDKYFDPRYLAYMEQRIDGLEKVNKMLQNEIAMLEERLNNVNKT